MAIYRSRGKREKKKAQIANVKSTTIPTKNPSRDMCLNVGPYIGLNVNMKGKSVVAGPIPARRSDSAIRLVHAMNLDEMLEASNAIALGVIGSPIPKIESPNAQRYAKTVLRLNSNVHTRPKAEKMLHNLNTQIIKVNKRTTDAAESKRLYRKFMAEE